MDIYSVSFTHPRRTRPIQPSADPHDPRLSFPHARNSEHFPSAIIPAHSPVTQPAANQAHNDTVDKLTKLVSSLFNVQVSWLLADGGRSWNFHVSGAYPQVMQARGVLLKDSPVQVCFFLFSSLRCSAPSVHTSLPLPHSLYPTAPDQYQGCSFRHT